ncbi:glycosyltransferase family 4 protein [Microvirga sp. 17 mud 1-3]|uniref:glycosyltransferase family 4 protein n=1 Tax=Microvirga sp. 17 mud 1-3 TaxID=2082949 RepID=UPI000D6B11E5|nr:glycosyltransferase family 4 protein [Microvirga sp. 17 mud 1-3]AWM87676.1 hypothetical protein C4E04_13660 [Microvirga sp. 17 mud 1-3]
MRRNAIILAGHDPDRDPRIGWLAASLAGDFNVCEVGIYEPSAHRELPLVTQVAPYRTQVRVHRNFHRSDVGRLIGASQINSTPAVSGLLYLQYLCSAAPRTVIESVGGQIEEDGVQRFRDLAKYLYNTNLALLEAARNVGGADLIVACDLDTVPAAAALAKIADCPFIYDAHEFWPHAFPKFAPWEIEAWSAFERLYMREAAYRITVSDPLAEALGHEYGVPFHSVPNAVPLSEGEFFDAAPVPKDGKEIVFLYQGGFAELRGIELLIDVWPKTDEHCILHLRGPDSSYKEELIERARATGLLDRRIIFPDAVKETELVQAAMAADVGLISYEPKTKNHIFCCPNKLSQYMAAGLPILANDLIYVADQIRKAQCGLSVDFDREADLLASIHRLANDDSERALFGANGRRYFETTFNWAGISASLLEEARSLAQRPADMHREMDFSWIDDRGTAIHPDVIKSRFTFWSEELSLYANELERLTRAVGDLKVSSRLRMASKPSRTKAAVRQASFVRPEMIEAAKSAIDAISGTGERKSDENREFLSGIGSLRERLSRGEDKLEDLSEARSKTQLCMELVRQTSAFVEKWVGALKHFDLQVEAVRLESLLLDSRRQFNRFCRQYREAYRALAAVIPPEELQAYATVSEIEQFGSFLVLQEEGVAQMKRIQALVANETDAEGLSEAKALDRYVNLLREVLAPLEALEVFYTQCIRRVELVRLMPEDLRQFVIGWDARLRWAKVQQLRGWRRVAVAMARPIFGVLSQLRFIESIGLPRILRSPVLPESVWVPVRAFEESHALDARTRPAGPLDATGLDKEVAFAAFLSSQIAAVRS